MWKNREDAADELAVLLKNFGGRNDVVVIALQRGGAVLGHVIAEKLRAPFAEMNTPSFQGKTVVLIDDGVNTGKSMLEAVATVRAGGAAKIIIAVPVAPPNAIERLRASADELFVLRIPSYLGAIGSYYEDPRI